MFRGVEDMSIPAKDASHGVRQGGGGSKIEMGDSWEAKQVAPRPRAQLVEVDCRRGGV
jgi:hypothetical protein